MARTKSSKIFIKIKDHLCDFMWVNIGPDDSVMLGFFTEGDEKTLLIISEEGEIKSNDIVHGNSLPNPKINFHKSGICKLTTQIGLTKNSIDRCSIFIGKRIDEITEPKRMLEVLIPKELRVTAKSTTNKDIILDVSKEASIFPRKPFRCTVLCMNKSVFQGIVQSNRRFFDTSLCERYDALEHKEQVWVFTLWISRENAEAPENYVFYVFGQIKWGQEIDGI